MMSHLSTGQLKNFSSFLLDLSKILIGSIVIGYFLPDSFGQINVEIFIGGTIIALSFFFFGIHLTPDTL